MTSRVGSVFGSLFLLEMARALILMMAASIVKASSSVGEVALANITRSSNGDLFYLADSDCGPTRCMEVSHGTALAAIGAASGCRCQCRSDKPAFREDQRVCINDIGECPLAKFGRGAKRPQIPYVFLPLKGQIIYPSKEIIFTDLDDAICAVTSAQYLSPSGWVTLRDLLDNDVPFGLYRDEGSTFLQWRGSSALHSRLEGRLVIVHVLCSGSAARLATSCAAFRIAGATQNALLDVRSIPFNAGETISAENSQNQGLSVLEALAIGVCVLLLVFVYAAGIIFYMHYKQKQKRKHKDPEQNHTGTMSTDGSSLESRIDMNNVMLKTNPLLQLNGMGMGMGGDFINDAHFSDGSELTEDSKDSSSNSTLPTNKFQKLNANVISAMVHSSRKKPMRPTMRNSPSPQQMSERFQRRSASPDTLERVPHSDLSIVDCTVDHSYNSNQHNMSSPEEGDTSLRKKLYFNPVFFEPEHLKDPPPAAIEFLIKIREVMSIAKDKMTSKRFLPILSDIPEEELYHTIDLGWDIPCARRGRRFSAISLKQENSRKTAHCGGCPGCDNIARPLKTEALTRSNSCKTCVSDDYKQRIVRKWLDEVPLPVSNSRPMKSIAKVNGTPRVIVPNNTNSSQFHPADVNMEAEMVARDVEPKMVPSDSPRKNQRIDQKSKNVEDNVNEKPDKNHGAKLNPFEIKNKVIEIKKEFKTEKENGQKEAKLMGTKGVPITKKDIEIIRVNGQSDHDDAKPVSANSTPEKQSPSNKTSRRIRKKLPPPPPPPPIPPESPQIEEEEEPIPLEVKVKMEAVIREFHNFRRVEPTELEEFKPESTTPIAPKIVIPVFAADSQYFSDDNLLATSKNKEIHNSYDNFMEFDSLERSVMKKRRFSVACAPDVSQKQRFDSNNLAEANQRLTCSWRDIKKAVHDSPVQDNSEVFISSADPLYDNETFRPGPLTIEVRGSPIGSRRSAEKDEFDFDPDTLDRRDAKKRVEKILLKSAGSFKYKSTAPPENEPCKESPIVTRKIGNLREIYEAKAKALEEGIKSSSRRGSVTYEHDSSDYTGGSIKAPDLIRHITGQKDPKPPIAPKQRRGSDASLKFCSSMRGSPPDERRKMADDRFTQYSNARRSGRRSARTRSRRDLRKVYRTEDSGYLSTDSNESKRRARYLMQLKPVKSMILEPAPLVAVKTVKPAVLQVESDTDDLESLCDGRSESGGESVETDSVFFGNFDDKDILVGFDMSSFDPSTKLDQSHEQIDSGFMGETNIILSGDSDSEHRSVISIITGHSGKISANKLDDSAYLHSVEC